MTRNQQANGNESNTKSTSSKETTMNIIKMTIIAFMLAFAPAWITGWAEECRDSTGAPVECEEDDTDQPDSDMDDPTKEDEDEDTSTGPTIMVDPQVEAFVVAMVETLQRERDATEDATVAEALGEAIQMLRRWNRSVQTCANSGDGDFNTDGTVDANDFLIWQDNLGFDAADASLDDFLAGCDPSLPQPEVGTIVAAAIESEPDESTGDTELLSLVLRMKVEVPSSRESYTLVMMAINGNSDSGSRAVCYLKYKLDRS